MSKLEYDPTTHGIYLKKDFLPVSKSWYINVINIFSKLTNFLSIYPYIEFNVIETELTNSISKMKEYLKQHE